jgi:hypothetical protein
MNTIQTQKEWQYNREMGGYHNNSDYKYAEYVKTKMRAMQGMPRYTEKEKKDAEYSGIYLTY